MSMELSLFDQLINEIDKAELRVCCILLDVFSGDLCNLQQGEGEHPML